MRSGLKLAVVVLILALTAAALMVQQTGPASAQPGSNVIPGQYIVTLDPSVKPRGVVQRLAREHGLEIRHVYESALVGFSARIPANKLNQVKADPAVVSVVEDRKVFAFGDNRPTGVRRTEADRNALAQIGSHTNPIVVDVAVIDTGIDAGHTDLNVVGGVSCVPGESSWNDAHGHGTHVAGTIGALDNGAGVVGVAPGARLWSVRVLNAQGEGDFSDVICGVDWVTASVGTIKVANMSLGGEGPLGTCTDGGLRQAICASVAAGVTYIAAAGNSSTSASSFVPAAYPEVMTVSAITDTDGLPGGHGPHSFFYGADDTFATYSNHGPAVDIAAPGTSITSTWIGGSYRTISGTSMASPHVAGAAAIYLYQNPGASPSEIRSHILSVAWEQSSSNGFTGDPDAFPEMLLNVGAIGGLPLLDPPPPPESGCNLSPTSGAVGTSVTVICNGFASSEWVWIYWDSTSTAARSLFIASSAGDGSATFTVPDSTEGEHSVIVRGSSSGSQVTQPFTVLPSLTPTSSSGTVGAFIYVHIKGFPASEPVDIIWHYGDSSSIVVKRVTTSTTGRASTSFQVPESAGDSYSIEAAGTSSGTSKTASFTVVAGVKVSPTVGRYGSNLTVSLSGYQPGEVVDVSWSATVMATATASPLGSASVTFPAPEAPIGNVEISGTGPLSGLATTSFRVTPYLVVSSSRDVVGSEITVNLYGFEPGETINLEWYDTNTSFTIVANPTASALGGATTTFTVPNATYGSHKVRTVGLASGGSSTVYFTVNARIRLSPGTGPAGTVVTVELSGYRADEPVDIRWYASSTASAVVASATTSQFGSVTTSFAVPADTMPGSYKIEGASTSSFTKASDTFVVEGAPGQPDADCEVNPASGPVGTSVTIGCYGFQPGEWVRIYLDNTSTTHRASFYTSTGAGSAAFTIPDAAYGEHLLIARGMSSGIEAYQQFNVTASITPATASGSVNAYVSVTVKGYGASETVNLIWHDGPSSSTVIKSVTTSSTGRASTSFRAPEAAGGVYTVEAAGAGSGASTAMTFTVLPGVKLSPTAGRVGSNLSITVNGYVPGESVELRWYDTATSWTALGTLTASASGAASTTITVPEATRGSHLVEGIGSSSGPASASYTVIAGLTLSTTSGPVGAEVTAWLTGFGPTEAVSLNWFDTSTSSTVIATVTTSPQGSATLIFTIPEATYGSHKITAVGTSSGASTTVYFTARAGISLSVTSGPEGTEVVATLTGFRAGETVNLRWYETSFSSTVIASGTTSSLGSATITFTVPAGAAPGDYKVEGVGANGSPKASETFTVT